MSPTRASEGATYHGTELLHRPLSNLILGKVENVI